MNRLCQASSAAYEPRRRRVSRQQERRAYPAEISKASAEKGKAKARGAAFHKEKATFIIGFLSYRIHIQKSKKVLQGLTP